MLKRASGITTFIVVLGVLAFYFLTTPVSFDSGKLPRYAPDPANGELLFWVGGCASCHASSTSKLLLGGGKALATVYGTFYSPNISTDPQFGIGGWSMSDFANAMLNGVSPLGEHYYPAFPYSYYRNMYIEDVMDLKAFLDTLPPSSNKTKLNEPGVPYSFKRGIGLWKQRYSAPSSIQARPSELSPLQRGQYLVDGPGHCGACHTPRDEFGGAKSASYLAGARSLEIDPDSPDARAEWNPNITPHADGLARWSERDIAYFFEMGFKPDFDTVGGSMVEVQENLAHLPTADLQAISNYLKSLPAIQY